MKKLFFFLITITFLQAENIAVVVSNNFDATELSKSQIKRIFLAKTNRVNSTKIKVVELKNTAYKKEFYKQVSGKSQAQLRSYWTTLIFTGKAQPPKQLQDMKELIANMKEDNRIITYIPESKITKDMKVLYTIKE
jgi:hypothetical protein